MRRKSTMPNLLTIEGVDTAIANLALAPGTLKARLIAAIRRLSAESGGQATDGIPAEPLIAELWGVAVPGNLPARRKGLSSLKSVLNRSLKELASQGLNPEGVVIGRTNRFEISEEQKNALLEKLGVGGQEGERLAEMFAAFRRAFPELGDDRGVEGLRGLFQRLEQAQGLIAELQGALGESERLLVELRGEGAGDGFRGREGGTGTGSTDADAGNGGTGEATAEGEIIEVEEELLADGLVAEAPGDLAARPGEAAGGLGAGIDTSCSGGGTDGETVQGEGGGDDPSRRPLRLLEVLSKYLDPETAAQEERGVMLESEEGLVGQLLSRFTPKFVGIKAGEFLLGGEGLDCRGPRASRRLLPAFYLGQYPVTNDLFELFVRETGYVTDAEREGHGLVSEGRWRSGRDASGLGVFSINSLAALARPTTGANWRHPVGPGSHLEGRHNHPVVQVSRRDALAFAAWAGKRLPSEAEWEAATRGPDGRPYPWGEDWEAGRRGNFASSFRGETSEVTSYGYLGSSPFGIRDLLGNVYEWVMPALPGQREGYLLKGGSWRSEGTITVCHRRVEPVDIWANDIGFRLAVSWQE